MKVNFDLFLITMVTRSITGYTVVRGAILIVRVEIKL